MIFPVCTEIVTQYLETFDAEMTKKVHYLKKTAGTRPAVTVRVRGRQRHVVEAIC